jgi:predicted secreted protein
MAIIKVQGTEVGKRIQASAGDAIMVYLSENPTTGYRWDIHRSDEIRLRLVDSSFTPQFGNAVGASGQRVFTFKAHSIGVVDLQLKNRREWEGDNSIIERFGIIVEIK